VLLPHNLIFSNRRWILERKLADAEVSKEEKNDILKNLEKKETEYMRLQRHKMGVDDFDLLTIIGRGAFGEVSLKGVLDYLLILMYLLIYIYPTHHSWR
jgi:hypothetical protein